MNIILTIALLVFAWFTFRMINRMNKKIYVMQSFISGIMIYLTDKKAPSDYLTNNPLREEIIDELASSIFYKDIMFRRDKKKFLQKSSSIFSDQPDYNDLPLDYQFLRTWDQMIQHLENTCFKNKERENSDDNEI